MSNRSIFKEQLSRRELGKIALGGALGATALSGLSQSSSVQEKTSSAAAPKTKWPRKGLQAQAPTWPLKGLHLSINAPANPTDEDFLLFQQLAIDCVYVRGMAPEEQTVEGLINLRNRYADAGIYVDDVDNSSVTANLDDIVLNTPGRDKAIEGYKSWLRTLGKAGLHQMESVMYGATGSVTSGEYEIRGGIKQRAFDINSNQITGSPWHVSGRGTINSLLFGRAYSREEIWANYTYFMKQIVPVAEEAGVRFGLLGDSPALPGPNPTIFGIARILSNPQDCEKALKIANSPMAGMNGLFGEDYFKYQPILAAHGAGGGGNGDRRPDSPEAKLQVRGGWMDEGDINAKIEHMKLLAKYVPNGSHTLGGALAMVGGRR